MALSWCLAVIGAVEQPVWPEAFHMSAWQTTPGDRSIVDLYYDWPHGRNLNIIRSARRAADGPLWDMEFQNGTSYYFRPKIGTCRTVEMGYGLLPPNWLKGASLIEEHVLVNGVLTDLWAKGESPYAGVPFIYYYNERNTSRPVRWHFYTEQVLDIIEWVPGETMDWWQGLPAYCETVPPGHREAPSSLAPTLPWRALPKLNLFRSGATALPPP